MRRRSDAQILLDEIAGLYPQLVRASPEERLGIEAAIKALADRYTAIQREGTYSKAS